MGKPTLLPCPFCGAAAKHEGWVGKDLDGGRFAGCTVWCGNVACHLAPEIATSTDVAVEHWNTRAPNPLAATIAARDERVRDLEITDRALRGLLDARAGIIATLEAEVAEARPKAEAAERRATAVRQSLRTTRNPVSVWQLEETDRDILAACPEKGGAG